ncbi:hypothetical protein [Niabella drilacis]|uniref:Uncharacterized protein n=1 Tax=Niabella drilacis (strain DSM 25811 / CCM 8410 / CCUG 62505 / LMG 26954 / E90) TaxID=1285928 RepID=A0A1G6I088_NIADE|nr:hypothetical protein [Niabella drilacis]SDB99166.1 hypothetical protein SAMN04487894_10120 [Niabella drilacis]
MTGALHLHQLLEVFAKRINIALQLFDRGNNLTPMRSFKTEKCRVSVANDVPDFAWPAVSH